MRELGIKVRWSRRDAALFDAKSMV